MSLESVLFKVSAMHSEMSPKFVRASEPLRAVGPCADVGLFSGVSTHVRFEMVRTGEFSLADIALEWTDTRVLAAMSSQLVRARETLSTTFMLAHVRLFSGVLPDVHLEVRELEVSLSAARVQANEWLPLFISLGVVYRCRGKGAIGAGWWWQNEGWLSSHGCQRNGPRS